MKVDEVQVVMVVHMYMGFVKCHTKCIKSNGLTKEPLMDWLGTFHFKASSMEFSNAWMPVARWLKLAIGQKKVKI